MLDACCRSGGHRCVAVHRFFLSCGSPEPLLPAGLHDRLVPYHQCDMREGGDTGTLRVVFGTRLCVESVRCSLPISSLGTLCARDRGGGYRARRRVFRVS